MSGRWRSTRSWPQPCRRRRDLVRGFIRCPEFGEVVRVIEVGRCIGDPVAHAIDQHGAAFLHHLFACIRGAVLGQMERCVAAVVDAEQHHEAVERVELADRRGLAEGLLQPMRGEQALGLWAERRE